MRISRNNTINKRFKKAQSVLEYALLVAVSVGALLGAGAYIKRAMQGQLQATSDQMADQYANGLTDLHEQFTSESRTAQVKWPGPLDTARSKGSFSARSERKSRPLDETQPFNN
ncbi:MAG: hypothetical protein ABH872_00615 [Candidatus Omnitrophota bacterium]